MPYKTVVFALFGVISSEIAPFWLSERFPADAARRIKSGLIADADRGLITQVEMFEKLAALSGSSPARVEAEWLAYAKLNGDLIAYISAIKPVVKVGLLTNATSQLVRHLLNVNQLEPLFDAIVVSSEVRSAKPDREIYEIALRKLSSAPSGSVMVDDNPDNIEGAVRAGMSGLVFSTNEKLATDLGL
jgi:putative hydrolase of the HAD superfamily